MAMQTIRLKAEDLSQNNAAKSGAQEEGPCRAVNFRHISDCWPNDR